MRKITATLGLLLSVSAFADAEISYSRFPLVIGDREVVASINDGSICTTKHNGWIDFEEGENCELGMPFIDAKGGYNFTYKCEDKEENTVLRVQADMGTLMLKEGLKSHYDKISVRCSTSKEHNFLVKSGEIQKVYSEGVTNRLYIEINKKFWEK